MKPPCAFITFIPPTQHPGDSGEEAVMPLVPIGMCEFVSVSV